MKFCISFTFFLWAVRCCCAKEAIPADPCAASDDSIETAECNEVTATQVELLQVQVEHTRGGFFTMQVPLANSTRAGNWTTPQAIHRVSSSSDAETEDSGTAADMVNSTGEKHVSKHITANGPVVLNRTSENSQADDSVDSTDEKYISKYVTVNGTITEEGSKSRTVIGDDVAGDTVALDLSLHVIGDEVGKAISLIDWQSWPWRTHWKDASGEAEEEKDVDLTMVDFWSIYDIFLLTAASLLLLAFDVTFSMSGREHTMKSHLFSLFLLTMLSIVYFLCVSFGHDWYFADSWLTCYTVEIAMSIENMFAIHLIFMALKVPEEQVDFALTVGIYGALALRLLLITFLERLFTVGYAMDVIVGILLILSGLLTLEDMEEAGVDDLAVTRWSKWIFGKRLLGEYDKDGRVFVRGPEGQLRFTLLFLVVWLVMFVDITFAVDSVGAKTANIANTYLNLSSAVMAVFTLRESFFVIRDAAKTFHLLKYGICLVLVLMGAQLLASKWLAIGLGWTCLGIGLIFMMSIFMSLIISVDNKDVEQDLRTTTSDKLSAEVLLNTPNG